MNTRGWVIRTANSKDIPFIYDTWLKSYKHDSTIGKATRSGIFFDYYKLIVDYILSHDATQTHVACLKDDENVILGYLVNDPSALHYCFVKDSFRKLGVATSLVQHAGLKSQVITHKTYSAHPIIQRFNFDFNPFLLYQRQIEGA